MEPSILTCPHCGHALSMFTEPEPDRGEQLAGDVAEVVASWWFPTLLLTAIGGWVLLNVIARPFEPYPTIMFAVLAATLSTIAALQGPLILLAQRRAAMRDRAREQETYVVAAHSEADLHDVSDRIDALARTVEDLIGAVRPAEQ